MTEGLWQHGGLPFSLSVYNDSTGELAAQGVPVTFMPHPGLVIYLAATGQVWEVKQVQVMVPDPRSFAAEHGYPINVEILAAPAKGIHARFETEEPGRPGVDEGDLRGLVAEILDVLQGQRVVDVSWERLAEWRARAGLNGGGES
jgi:hypothetical protein